MKSAITHFLLVGFLMLGCAQYSLAMELDQTKIPEEKPTPDLGYLRKLLDQFISESSLEGDFDETQSQKFETIRTQAFRAILSGAEHLIHHRLLWPKKMFQQFLLAGLNSAIEAHIDYNFVTGENPYYKNHLWTKDYKTHPRAEAILDKLISLRFDQKIMFGSEIERETTQPLSFGNLMATILSFNHDIEVEAFIKSQMRLGNRDALELYATNLISEEWYQIEANIAKRRAELSELALYNPYAQMLLSYAIFSGKLGFQDFNIEDRLALLQDGAYRFVYQSVDQWSKALVWFINDAGHEISPLYFYTQAFLSGDFENLENRCQTKKGNLWKEIHQCYEAINKKMPTSFYNWMLLLHLDLQVPKEKSELFGKPRCPQ